MNPVPPPATAATSPWLGKADPRRRLAAAAALATTAGGLLLTALGSGIAGEAVRSALARRTGAAIEAEAHQLGDRLDQLVGTHLRALRVAASLNPVRTPGVAAAERRRTLLDLLDQHPDLAWIALADAQGRVVAATPGVSEGAGVEQRPWFRGALEQAFVSDPREVPGLPRPPGREGGAEGPPFALDLAVPVADPDGNPAGVLAAALRWDAAQDALRAVLPEERRRERTGATVYAAAGEVLLDSGASGWSQPPEAPAAAGNRRWRGWLEETTALGTTYLTGYARSRGFRDHRGLGWLTVVRQPAEIVLVPAAEVRRTVAAWGLAFTALAAIAAGLAAERLGRRLRAIGRAADRIRRGDVLATLPGDRGGDGELERMCRSLRDLVDALRPPPDRSPAPPLPPRRPRT